MKEFPGKGGIERNAQGDQGAPENPPQGPIIDAKGAQEAVIPGTIDQ